MSEETWTRDELFEDRDLAPAFVTELQRLGLLRIVARDVAGEPLYAPDAREELDKVLALVEMGYEPKDIAAIARKVGLPPRQRTLFRRPPMCLALDALVERSEVDRGTVEDWIAQGVIAPRLISERGVPLFSLAQVEQVRLLNDLAHLGADQNEVEVASRALTTLIARGGAPEAGPDPDTVAELGRVLQDLNEFLGIRRRAIRRWTRSLGRMKRRLSRLRRGDGGGRRTPRLGFGRRRRAGSDG